VAEVLRQGADLCTFSGDKLLGGPQAGILAGRREVVGKVLAHPLMRAVRCDKMTLAALEATLEIYRDGEERREIPTLQMLGASPAELVGRKERLLAALRALGPRVSVSARRVRSAVGGGALPLAEPETWALAVTSQTLSADEIARRLAARSPAIVTRISDGEVLLDVRTIADGEVAEVATALQSVLRETASA
jgi:L-seryl-tRNA(Ser) seleniumtransferase